MKRFGIQAGLTALLALVIGWFVPWWSVVIAGMLAAFVLGGRDLRDLGAGFAGGFLLWFFLSMGTGTFVGGPLAARVGELIGGLSPFLLYLVTGALAGIAAGLGAMAGGQIRVALFGKKTR